MNDRYGENTFCAEIRDSYSNMREIIDGHMELIENEQASMRSCGVEPHCTVARGGTDGATLSFRGIPCPNLCTGGVNFHGVHEYIPAGALETMTQVLVNLVKAE